MRGQRSAGGPTQRSQVCGHRTSYWAEFPRGWLVMTEDKKSVWQGTRCKSALNNPRGVVWWVLTACWFEIAPPCTLDFLPHHFILRLSPSGLTSSCLLFSNWVSYPLRFYFQPIMAGSSSPAGKPEKTMSSNLLTMKV